MKGYNFEEAIKHLSKDTILNAAIKSIDLPERNPSTDVYGGLIRSIVSQQLSVKAAHCIGCTGSFPGSAVDNH